MPVCTLPDLPYDHSALAPVLGPGIIELHHAKHHAAYVKGGGEPLEQVYDHRGNVGRGATPILVLDAWQHAFHLRYRNQKADFAEAVGKVVDRQDVARRYEAAATSRTDVPLLAP